MMRAPFALLSGLMLTVAVPALAVDYLPAGVVACINQKAAANFAKYSVSAPDFARDLIDRATCYVNKDEVQVVKLGGSGEYVQYQLLTGHKIWVRSADLKKATAVSVGN